MRDRTPEEVLPGLSCPAKRSSYAGAASVGMEFVPMFFSVVLSIWYIQCGLIDLIERNAIDNEN